jgi:hypothetical protein
VLAQWDVTSVGGPIDESVPFAATFQGVGVLASGISLGAGVTPSTENPPNQYTANMFTTSGALDPLDFFELSISSTIGETLLLESLTYTMERDAEGPQSGVLRTSFDGFSSNLHTWSMIGGAALQTVDLTSFAPLTSQLTFRFYGFGSTHSTDGRAAFYASPVTIHGELSNAAVPEASSLLVWIGLATIGIVLYARRWMHSVHSVALK